jgi:predicted O-methyltransferase YrrM
MSIDEDIAGCLANTNDRLAFWTELANRRQVETVCEIGVFRGVFAAHLLENVPGIRKYYLLDPWRKLDHWKKPANRKNDKFQRIYKRAMKAVEPYSRVTEVLRGTTTEKIGEIKDGTLDLAYVDGDHTLRGVSIDLIKVYPKLKPGGLLAGDDFISSIFQHGEKFEPTLVFPFAVYFAEAVGCPIWGLPNNQFLIVKDEAAGFEFTDLTGKYEDTALRSQIYGAVARHDRKQDAQGKAGPGKGEKRGQRAAAGEAGKGTGEKRGQRASAAKGNRQKGGAAQGTGKSAPGKSAPANQKKNIAGRVARRLSRMVGPGTSGKK